jgi:hypothetical protein
MNVITAGAVSALLLEGLKWIWRKWVVKDPAYNFNPKFYLVALPILNFLLIPALAFLQIPGYALPADWQAWLLQLSQTVLATFITVFSYEFSVRPLKAYNEAYKLTQG